MKQFGLVVCGAACFILACADIPGDNKTIPSTEQGGRRTPSFPSTTPSSPSTTPSSQPVSLNSAEFQQFKQDFNARFGGYNSLPADVLYQIIEAVPSQSTTWGCGLVQSNMARAAASLSLGWPIDRQQVANCNTVQDYPLLVDEPMPQAKKTQIDSFLFGNKLEVENVNGVDRFRVGGDPRTLPDYLNSKLPPAIRASLVEKAALNKNELINLINENLLTGMPLITLTVANAANFTLHYYSIVGVNATNDTVLVLHTKGQGVDRLKVFGITDFINKAMNLEDFRVGAQTLASIAPFAVTIGIELPDLSRINSLANFNLIKFSKI